MKKCLAYNSYYVVFGGATLGLSIVLAIFNILIDPYGITGSPTFVSINRSKPEKGKHVRLFKAVEIVREPTKVLVLGTSRVDAGLDPNHPALKSLQPGYNLALPGTNMYEIRRYFEHAIANQKEIELVILGLDSFRNFDYDSTSKSRAGFDESRLGEKKIRVKGITVKDAVETSLSIDTFLSSYHTIAKNIQEPDYISYHPWGQRYATKEMLEGKQDMDFFLAPIADLIHKNNYEISQEGLRDFEAIITRCQELNIELLVFIQPTHAVYMEMTRAAGLWPLYEKWKQEIVNITSVWDFSGYNSITTEKIRQGMQHYIESSHYYKEVGDLMLNRMLGFRESKVPGDFGVLLTSNNLDSHLARIRSERDRWAKENPDVLKRVENLKHRKK